MANIIGIDQVQVAMPPGGEVLARRFYGGVPGLPALAQPASLAVRDGLWFGCDALQLHLGGERNSQAAKKPHPALLLGGQDGFLPGLMPHGIELRHEEAIAGTRRVALADPLGHCVEPVERLPAAPDARASR
jgi:hypothetical protein